MTALLPWSMVFAAALLGLWGWRAHRRQRLAIAALRVDNAALAARVTGASRGQCHPLTGLPTREPLLAAIDAAERGILAVLALADFDRLATFDPALADRVTVAQGDRLRALLAGRHFLAQVDRGQFAVWFDDGTADAALAEIATLADALRRAVPDGARHLVPRIDAAHARWPEDGADAAGLLARATAALSVGALSLGARAGGVADVAAHARGRYLMEQDLRQAVAEDGFRLAFQPLVEAGAAGERVIGAEALVRWHHPRRGEVPPAVFVPLLEEIGLADRLGAWALDAALAAAAGWPAGWRVAVNVSAQQLERGDLAALVEGALARHGVPAARLEIELTETIAAADLARAAALFDRLRTLGVGIAIDDFGTGFSSFSAVRRLRFDKIKIDREFVTEVHRRRDSQAICQSIIALARGLDAAVLAEGVEGEAEYRWLRDQGCRLFQGYRFSPPLDLPAFAALAAR